MKKLVSIISALTMCAVMAAPIVSSAADVKYADTEKTSTVDCKTVVESSYTVTIPDGTADLKDPADLVVSATDVCIKGNQTLTVDVTSANAWKLHDEYAGDLAYKLTAMKEVETEVDGEVTTTFVEITEPVLDEDGEAVVDEEGEAVVENKVLVSGKTANVDKKFTVLEVKAGTPSGKSIMRAEVEDKATMAGTYKDTLTFTVSVTPEDETPAQTGEDEPQTPPVEEDGE